jgi:HK97 family phage prohead protease
MHHKLLNLEHTSVKFDETRKGFFSGYASVFGGVDAYGDTVHPGAYKSTLQSRNRPIQMRWNHFGEVIGKWTSIQEDDVGLYVEGELTPGHSKAQDVYASLKHGAITGMSIGYRPVKAVKNDNGGVDLHEIELVEISVVESPADLNATVSDVKSAIARAESLKEIEGLLRDAGGFSRADATALVARIKSLTHGEREAEAKTSDILAAIQAATLKLTGVK